MNTACVSRAFDLKSTSNPHVAGLNIPHTNEKKSKIFLTFAESSKKKKKKKMCGVEPRGGGLVMF
jgi:hypothetical protein